MDEAQVLALIQAQLTEFKGTFSTEIGTLIDQKNSGLAANLTREIKKLTEKPADPPPATDPSEEGDRSSSEGKLTLKALLAEHNSLKEQFEALQKETETEKATAVAAKRQSALDAAIANAKPLNPGALRKLLSLEYGEKLKEEGGKWFVDQGESAVELEKAIATYLSSDEGKAFMPPSGTSGAGSTESNAKTPPAGAKPDVNAALLEAF